MTETPVTDDVGRESSSPEDSPGAEPCSCVFERMLRFLFEPPSQGQRAPWPHVLALAVLFLGGVLHWLFFFNFGRMDFSIPDWARLYPFLDILQQAVSTGKIPWGTTHPFLGDTDFMALPFIPWSPQIVLLKFLPLGQYITFNCIFLYAFGFHGCLLLRRRYGLSLVAFGFLFLLTNFNGYVTAHLSTGHSTWWACFFLPYFVYLVAEIRKDHYSMRTALLLALVLFLILLQGAIHIFLACCLFLLLVVLANLSTLSLSRFACTCGFSVLLGAFRFVPTFLFLGSKPRAFIPGYSSFISLIENLTVLRNHTYTELEGVWLDYLNAWEYDVYIGMTGFIFVVFGGVYLRYRKSETGLIPRFKNMDWPVWIMVLLAMGPNYFFVIDARIPFLSTAARLPARFIGVPLFVLIILACIRFQTYLAERPKDRALRVVSLLGLLHLAHLFRLHSSIWRFAVLERETGNPFPPDGATLLASGDPTYMLVVKASFAVSLFAVMLWAYLYRRSPAESGEGHAGDA